MTLKAKIGLDNITRSIAMALRAGLPAAINAMNAALGVQLVVPLRANYVIAAEASFKVTPSGDAFTSTSEIEVTVPAATYTAAALIALLNADDGFKSELIASAVGLNQIMIESKTLGVAGRLTIGNGTINSVLGLSEGQQFSFRPLAQITRIRAEHGSLATPVIPSIAVWPSSLDIDQDEYIASVVIDVRVTAPFNTADLEHPLLNQLVLYCEVIEKLLKSETTYGGHLVGARVTGIQIPRDLFALDESENQLVAVASINLDVTTEEEPS